MSVSLNLELEDLPTGLPQALTEENSDIAGRGLGIVLAGRRQAGDGPVSWRVLVFRGLDQHDPYVVWTIWKETHTDTTPFRDVWYAINGRYTDDLGQAAAAFLGLIPGREMRGSPAL